MPATSHINTCFFTRCVYTVPFLSSVAKLMMHEALAANVKSGYVADILVAACCTSDGSPSSSVAVLVTREALAGKLATRCRTQSQSGYVADTLVAACCTPHGSPASSVAVLVTREALAGQCQIWLCS
jgi:hypothetical protein